MLTLRVEQNGSENGLSPNPVCWVGSPIRAGSVPLALYIGLEAPVGLRIAKAMSPTNAVEVALDGSPVCWVGSPVGAGFAVLVLCIGSEAPVGLR